MFYNVTYWTIFCHLSLRRGEAPRATISSTRMSPGYLPPRRKIMVTNLMFMCRGISVTTCISGDGLGTCIEKTITVMIGRGTAHTESAPAVPNDQSSVSADEKATVAATMTVITATTTIPDRAVIVRVGGNINIASTGGGVTDIVEGLRLVHLVRWVESNFGPIKPPDHAIVVLF